MLYALANHDVTEARIDDMVQRKLYAMITTGLMDNSPHGGEKIDFAAATAFAQSAEEQSIVLLKNDGAQLPLSDDSLKNIAVIGSHADVAVGTGGGSGDTMKPITGLSLRLRRATLWYARRLRLVENSMAQTRCFHR